MCAVEVVVCDGCRKGGLTGQEAHAAGGKLRRHVDLASSRPLLQRLWVAHARGRVEVKNVHNRGWRVAEGGKEQQPPPPPHTHAHTATKRNEMKRKAAKLHGHAHVHTGAANPAPSAYTARSDQSKPPRIQGRRGRCNAAQSRAAPSHLFRMASKPPPPPRLPSPITWATQQPSRMHTHVHTRTHARTFSEPTCKLTVSRKDASSRLQPMAAMVAPRTVSSCWDRA
jgi:hypothetical protein